MPPAPTQPCGNHGVIAIAACKTLCHLAAAAVADAHEQHPRFLPERVGRLCRAAAGAGSGAADLGPAFGPQV